MSVWGFFIGKLCRSIRLRRNSTGTGFEITMPGSDAATAPRGLKILVVGPSAAGKSALANFLGDPECDSLQQPATYNETKGVR